MNRPNGQQCLAKTKHVLDPSSYNFHLYGQPLNAAHLLGKLLSIATQSVYAPIFLGLVLSMAFIKLNTKALFPIRDISVLSQI